MFGSHVHVPSRLGHGVHMTCSFPLIDLGTPTNIYCNFIFTLLDLSQLLHVGDTFYSHNVEDVFSVCCRHRHWYTCRYITMKEIKKVHCVHIQIAYILRIMEGGTLKVHA